MSLFYDRTANTTGVELLTGFSYKPEYGSSANFTTKNNQFNLTDRMANLSPMGLNTVVGDFSINLQLRESDAQKLVRFYENQSGTGVFPITDDSNIYRTLSGTIGALTSFDSANNNKYQVGIGFSVERNASVLKWSGQSFVNHQFLRWETGQSYDQYDIVWFENDLDEPVNNFFYCTGAHTSAISNHPLSTGQKWTTNLFLDTNEQFSFQQKPFVSANDFKDSFFQRVNDQKNIHSFESIDISYKNISDKKTKALLHFCESRLGHKRFSYTFPEIYNRPKTFFAPSWNHQWNTKDSNNVKISAIEDPFGMIPSGRPAIYTVQNAGNSSFSFSISGSERLFYDTGNGKQLITGVNNTLSWPISSTSHSVTFWGKIAGFTGSGQSLRKFQLGGTRDLSHLNISANNISVFNSYDANNLVYLNCSGNSIGGFDLAGKSGLRHVDCRNNGATYINIGGCTNLTGLYAQGNSFPTIYTDGALRELAINGKSSGYVNLSGSSGISQSSLVYASALTGRFWNVGYQYYPIAESTTNAPSTTTPAPVNGYSFSLNYSESSELACTSTDSVTVQLNSPTMSVATKVNFAGVGMIISGANVFYLSNGSGKMLASKTCCDKADLAYLGSCSITTEPPSTTTANTTVPYTTIPYTTIPFSTTVPP